MGDDIKLEGESEADISEIKNRLDNLEREIERIKAFLKKQGIRV